MLTQSFHDCSIMCPPALAREFCNHAPCVDSSQVSSSIFRATVLVKSTEQGPSPATRCTMGTRPGDVHPHTPRTARRDTIRRTRCSEPAVCISRLGTSLRLILRRKIAGGCYAHPFAAARKCPISAPSTRRSVVQQPPAGEFWNVRGIAF